MTVETEYVRSLKDISDELLQLGEDVLRVSDPEFQETFGSYAPRLRIETVIGDLERELRFLREHARRMLQAEEDS